MSEPAVPGINEPARPAGTPAVPGESRSAFRPAAVHPVSLADLAAATGVALGVPAGETTVTGITLNSRAVEPGDLYVALQGASRHGADFVAQAAGRGAHAVLTDEAGARILALDETIQLPVLVAPDPRELVGRLAARIYGGPADGAAGSGRGNNSSLKLFAVTGTNGKTTTTYFVNSLLRALGQRPGLIGTIEILAGGEAIPSLLTTPESPDVHALLALMRERGLDSASMEVSSHALAFHRVDGVMFDVAGFTNLTQDHLDLHGTLEDYFQTKAELFTPARTRAAVVTVDDDWGRQLAAQTAVPVLTLATGPGTGQAAADWTVSAQRPKGLGSEFTLTGRDGTELTVHCGLPGGFNVSNAALATVMVLASGVAAGDVQRALDVHDPFMVAVPGRMQLVATRPAAVVDFAHNPDALARALEAVRPPTPEAKLIVVFGATGQRDQGKRPGMGAIAAAGADVVIVTDDDPHDEDAAAIRADVLAGAIKARDEGNLDCTILDIFPRAEAIERAVALAGPLDTILVAGRGHEVWQEVKGVNLPLDDRVELRAALTARGFNVLQDERIES